MSSISTQRSFLRTSDSVKQSTDAPHDTGWMTYLSTLFRGESVPPVMSTGSEYLGLQEEEVVTEGNTYPEAVCKTQEFAELKPVTCNYNASRGDAQMELVDRTVERRYTDTQNSTMIDVDTTGITNFCNAHTMSRDPDISHLNIHDSDIKKNSSQSIFNHWNHLWSNTSKIPVPDQKEYSKENISKESTYLTSGMHFSQHFHIQESTDCNRLRNFHSEQNPILLFPTNFKLLRKEKEDKFILVSPQGSSNPIFKHNNQQSHDGYLQLNLPVNKSPLIVKTDIEAKPGEDNVEAPGKTSGVESATSNDNLANVDVEEVLESIDPALDIMENTFSCIPCTEPISQEKPKYRRKLKRPMNAFMIWARKYRTLVASELPGTVNSQVSVRLGEIWNKLPMSQQRPYFVAAEKLKRDYEAERPKYNFDWLPEVKKEEDVDKKVRRKKRKRFLTANMQPCLAAAQFLIGVKKEAGTYEDTNNEREQIFACRPEKKLDQDFLNVLTSTLLLPVSDPQNVDQSQFCKETIKSHNEAPLVVDEAKVTTLNKDLNTCHLETREEAGQEQHRQYKSPGCSSDEDGLLQDVMMNIEICEESIALEKMSKDNAEFFDVTDLDRYLTNISPPVDVSCESKSKRRKGTKKNVSRGERERRSKRKKKSLPP